MAAEGAGEDDAGDEWVEKEAMTAPPEEDILDKRDRNVQESKMQRDSWMEAPSTLEIDYLQQNRRKKSPPSQFVSAKESHERKIHKHEVDELLKDLEEDEDEDAPVEDEPAQHDVSYTFGDGGASWRMTKLRGVYRKAQEDNKSVDEVALRSYGDLRLFDDAREEERELDRRETYGKDYVGLDKPSGEFFQERKMAAGKRRKLSPSPDATGRDAGQIQQGQQMEEQPAPARTVPLDQTALNKLKAQLMKAKLRKDPKAADLEAEYNAAAAAASANGIQADIVVLSNMDNRMLAGGRGNEVKAIDNKRGRERGTVVENEDMSIEDMVRHEKRTRGMQGGEGRAFAERIAKDARFDRPRLHGRQRNQAREECRQERHQPAQHSHRRVPKDAKGTRQLPAVPPRRHLTAAHRAPRQPRDTHLPDPGHGARAHTLRRRHSPDPAPTQPSGMRRRRMGGDTQLHEVADAHVPRAEPGRYLLRERSQHGPEATRGHGRGAAADAPRGHGAGVLQGGDPGVGRGVESAQEDH